MAEEMNEDLWTQKVCEKLNEHFANTALHAKIQVDIPYGIKIKEFNNIEDISKKKEHWKLTHDRESEDTFAADLLIYEEDGDGNIIPRVVMEAKYKRFSTHDAITYGKKAVLHKSLMPTLRYGMILGAMEDKGLAGRLFEHGGDFDFMFSFKDEKPAEGEELESFFGLVDSEIESSECLKEMFDSKNKKADYYYLQRKLMLK